MFHIDCCCLVTKSWPTVCDPVDCSLPGSSIHGILQARMLAWVATAFSRGSGDHSLLRGFSQRRDETWVSCVADGLFTIWATRETPELPWTPFSPLFLWSPIASRLSLAGGVFWGCRGPSSPDCVVPHCPLQCPSPHLFHTFPLRPS